MFWKIVKRTFTRNQGEHQSGQTINSFWQIPGFHLNFLQSVFSTTTLKIEQLIREQFLEGYLQNWG